MRLDAKERSVGRWLSPEKAITWQAGRIAPRGLAVMGFRAAWVKAEAGSSESAVFIRTICSLCKGMLSSGSSFPCQVTSTGVFQAVSDMDSLSDLQSFVVYWWV